MSPAPTALADSAAGASARRAAIDSALVEALTGPGLLSGDCAALVAALAGAIGWQAGSLLEFDPEQGALCCLIFWHHPEIPAAPFGELTRGIRFAPGLGLPGRVHDSGRPLWITGLSADPNFPRSAAAAEASIHSAFAVPARSERFSGVLEFFSEQTRPEDHALVAEMSAVATHVARYVEHMREHSALRESEGIKAAMLESSFDCIVGMDQNGRVIEFNAAAERVFGYPRSHAVGADLAQLIVPAALREHHRNGLRRYLAGGEGLMLNRRIETRAQRSDGTELPVELAITHIHGTDPPHFVAYLRDIEDRKQTEDVLRFLADAGSALDSSLDLDATLQNVARLSVPFLGDGCMVDLLDDGGGLHRVAAAATDPALEPVLQELQRHRFDPAGPHPIARAARTGELQVVHSFDEALREQIAEGDEEYLAALGAWPARSAVVAPLKARGRRLGALALASFTDERKFGPAEVAVIEQLASRASIAIDNARLYQQARSDASP